jgi:hypothetical protein
VISRFITNLRMACGESGMDPTMSKRLCIRTARLYHGASPGAVDARRRRGYAARQDKQGVEGYRKPVQVRRGPATVTGERTR